MTTLQPAPDADLHAFVLRSDREGVATLTLNRGEQYNPLSMGMMQALIQTLTDLSAVRSVKVIVLKGAGKGFCAGHDLKEMRADLDPSALRSLFNQCNVLMQTIRSSPQVVIAQVHGIATAAGCQLTATCDLAIAAQGTRFALPGVNIGLFCSTPAVAVSRQVSRKNALRMLLTGDTIDAVQARDWGLINDVVPLEKLAAEVQQLADIIKSKSAAVVALGKHTFYQQIELDISAAYSLAAQAMVENMTLPDSAEGIDAFVNKREPRWLA